MLRERGAIDLGVENLAGAAGLNPVVLGEVVEVGTQEPKLRKAAGNGSGKGA